MTSQAILELQDGSSAGLQNGRIAKGDLQEESALDLPLFVHGAIPALRQDSLACFWSASRIGRGYSVLGTRYWVLGTGSRTTRRGHLLLESTASEDLIERNHCRIARA